MSERCSRRDSARRLRRCGPLGGGLLAGLSSLALMHGTALAQAAAPAAAEQARPAGIEEIVVTAQKRAENLQEAPLAITALTGSFLDRKAGVDLKALNGSVPNLVVTSVVNVGMTAAVSIRGIGVQEADGFIDPAVGVVVDGVFQGSNTTALLDLFDVERLEVLRGPQGTLFGANTIGGVINVITKQPSGEFGGAARATVGNYGRVDVMGAIDVPIVEGVLSGKIVAMSKNFDGFYRDLQDGKRTGGQHVTSGRGYLKLTPNDSFDATLQFEYGRGRNDSPPVVNYSTPDMALYAAGFSKAFSDPVSYDTASQHFNYSDYNIYGGTLTMNWDTGPVKLTSISNYREFTLDEWTDQDGTPVDLYRTRRITDHWQFSQELRGTVNPTDTTELLLGAFYLQQNYKLDSTSYLDAFAPGLVSLLTNDQDDKSWSGFAQGYWNVTDALRLQAGVRYTWQKKHMIVGNLNEIGALVLSQIDADAEESWTHWGWRIGADYKITDDAMIYAYQARGAHSGGFNGRITFVEDIGPYNPEKVDTYEVGVKTQWLDRRLQVNLAGFYNKYKEMQVDQLAYVNNNATTQVLNAASATIKGVELETIIVPIEGLTINGTVSYLDASYDKFFLDLDANPGNGQEDGSFLELRNAPEWQTALGATYEIPMGPGYTAFNAQWSYTSHRQTDTRNAPIGRVKGVHLVDASIKWTRDNDSWSVTLWGKNIFDERYIASGFFAPGVMNFASYSNPREVGATFAVNF